MSEKYGFVYIWYDRKHKRYYIGCHWGTEDDGYVCSSTWMKRAYKRRPEDFKRRIIKRNIPTVKEMFTEEYNLLLKIDKDELGKKYYNYYNGPTYHWSMDEKLKKEVIEKVSIKQKGKRNSPKTEIKKGERRSPETEFVKGQIPHNKGKKLNDEVIRNKMKQNKSGIKNGERTRFKKDQTSGKNNVNAKSINTPIGRFDTITETTKVLGISHKVIRRYLLSENKDYAEWFYI